MGSSKTSAELVSKLRALGTATERSAHQAVSEGALATKTIMVQAATARGLSTNSRLAGRKWSVGYDVKGGRQPVALVRYRGPFHLFDNPTQPHFIVAKRLGQRTSRRSRGQRAQGAALVGSFGLSGSGAFGGIGDRRGAKALTIGPNFRAYARHPGTSGAGSFSVAKIAAKHRVPRVMASSVKGAWRSALG